ncbi:MAG: ATP-binding cassette domain-containing protein, partial [Romboutsia sp.]|nr:ATP-binding cassette domain-containing protein [Romboutsia sp.]
VHNVSFDVKGGEIVGIAGLMGAGRTELAKTIYGYYKKQSGEIYIKGKKIENKSAKDGLKNGIAYVSEDRKGDGLILGLSVKENMSISSLDKVSSLLSINKSKELKEVKNYIDKMNIKTPSENQIIKNLSGGNQQKVAIGKALMTNPDVLILDEPTRGVDVGAKKEIYDLINEFKKEGKAVIMISSEMPEILGMSDRILVISDGKLTGEFDREDATQEIILKSAVSNKGV